jgi:hypothetical protein
LYQVANFLPGQIGLPVSFFNPHAFAYALSMSGAFSSSFQSYLSTTKACCRVLNCQLVDRLIPAASMRAAEKEISRIEALSDQLEARVDSLVLRHALAARRSGASTPVEQPALTVRGNKKPNARVRPFDGG